MSAVTHDDKKKAPEQDPPTTSAHGAAEPSSALPHRDAIERAFGQHDISNVGVHSASDQAYGAVGGAAYAQGNNIAVAPGEEHALGHEAAHVVQQRGR